MSYIYTDDPPEKLAQAFPCNKLMHWPKYKTKVINTEIDGRKVVIQLWKGYCPSYLPGIVGGIGAEVGIYTKKNPSIFGNLVPGEHWWPDHEHKKDISFTLVDPLSKDVFFTAESKHCWWLHKWMTEPSYIAYKQKHEVPKSPDDYILKYTIQGKEYTW